MYNKNDKRRLYQLMEMYLTNFITASVFCDEFYYSYDLEIDNNTLTNIEKLVFSDLSKVSSRFSEYEEDHKLDSRAFTTAKELRGKIIETKEKLKPR